MPMMSAGARRRVAAIRRNKRAAAMPKRKPQQPAPWEEALDEEVDMELARARARLGNPPQPAPWEDALDEVDMELARLAFEISAAAAQEKVEGGGSGRLALLLEEHRILAARSEWWFPAATTTMSESDRAAKAKLRAACRLLDEHGDEDAGSHRLALLLDDHRDLAARSALWDPAAMTTTTTMSESDRAAKAEKLREEKLRAARRLLDEYGNAGALGSRLLLAEARCIDFDPKQGGIYFNGFCHDPDLLDLDEESPIGPMRFTDTIYGGEGVDSVGLNILSVKIACSDIGFPIQVYGTVFARDSIDDYKRVYLFRRDSDHPQLISSEKEGLILSGPKRALVWSDDGYIETDLWVKDDQGHCREFSKGLLTIPGSAWHDLHGRRRVVGIESLATRLSTVDVRYEVVQYAVEATIAVEVLQGEFRGLIGAQTSSSKKRILTLYDSSKVADGKVADGGAVIQLMRPALSVCVQEDELIILARTAGGEHYKGLKIPPSVNGGDVGVFTLGDVVMRVNVNWSIMD